MILGSSDFPHAGAECGGAEDRRGGLGVCEIPAPVVELFETDESLRHPNIDEGLPSLYIVISFCPISLPGSIAMSVTTVYYPPTLSLQQTLREYDVHVTGHPTASSQLSSSLALENPPSWPHDRHRVPHYRPVNRNLNIAERPNGSNLVEWAFINVMFTGVALNGVSTRDADSVLPSDIRILTD